nr:hypothetical protein BaRGS_022887 [Batillaria attramentaria]
MLDIPDYEHSNVEKILSSVGIEAEADKVKKVGSKKLASMPAGGAVAAGGAAAPAAGGAAPAAEAKKEEKKEESEESDDDMGFGLFD